MNWTTVYNYINDERTSMVYISIGSYMGHYQQITSENNQQYPCFLDNFQGRKIVILIDPELESPLKVQEYFIEKENPLQIIDTNNLFRILENDEVTVIAINDTFFFEITPYMENEEIDKTYKDIYILKNIIRICLSKQQITKLIVQDYTGHDTTNFYLDLIDSKEFNLNDLLNHILFDVTEGNGVCSIQFNSEMIKFNSYGNFIQDKYLPLTDSSDANEIKKREELIKYPIHWIAKKLANKEEFRIFSYIQYTQIHLMATVYGIDYKQLIKNDSKSLCLYIKLMENIMGNIESLDKYEIS